MGNTQQLVKKGQEGYDKVFPKTFLDAIKDRETGMSLTDILSGFNNYFLSYSGDKATTRLQVPSVLRKEGLWVTYVDDNRNVITEWYNNDSIDDKSWSDSSNWRIASNYLVGNISISDNGKWVINNKETEFNAVGETGITPLLRMGPNNKIQVSYNEGKLWEDISDYVVPKFRWVQGFDTTAGKIQISMDLGSTWTDLSNNITNNLRISKYIGPNESLPTSGIAEGTIYMKGPIYDENDTLNENPIYRMWVYAWKGNTLAWQDNGEFTSISAGVVQTITPGSTNTVPSTDAVYQALKDSSKGFVDEEPVAGSENLVRSGGCFGSINKVLGVSQKLHYQKVDNYYIPYDTGSAVYNVNYECTDFIGIKPNNSYTYNGKITQIAGVAFYDSNKQYISGVLTTTFMTPANAAYVRMTNDKTNIIDEFILTDNNGLVPIVEEYEVLKPDILDCIDTLKYQYDYPKRDGLYIDARTGNIGWNSNYECTDFIAIKSNNSYSYNGKITQIAGVAFYDINEDFISGTLYATFTTPANAAYVRMTNDKTNVIDKFILINRDSLISKVTELESELTNNYLEKNKIILNNAFAGFRKFGVIGDSLSVGHNTDPITSTTHYRDIPNSWGQVLARDLGNTCLNFGRSGISSKTWQTDQYCYPLFSQSENLCQCYIIGLGVNDSGNNIGTIEDIDWSDYTKNEDSFYGNYAKIIQQINEIAPRAIVFCLTIPGHNASTAKNDAIRNIVNNANVANTYLTDLAANYNEYIVGMNGYLYDYHYNAAGYAIISKIIAFAINEVINAHASDSVIRGIGNIPFGSNNVIN